MQPVSDLEKLRDSLIFRSRRLKLAWNGRSSLPFYQQRVLTAHITIELDNLLVGGLKNYLKSTLMEARTLGRVRISCATPSDSSEAAAAFILSTLNNGKYRKLRCPAVIAERDEQTFREPRDALRVLTACGASNIPSLLNAMAYNGNLFSEIATVRNFFAHRAKSTNFKVAVLSNNIGFLTFIDAEDFVTSVRPLTHLSIMEGWMQDFDTFFEQALL